MGRGESDLESQQIFVILRRLTNDLAASLICSLYRVLRNERFGFAKVDGSVLI